MFCRSLRRGAGLTPLHAARVGAAGPLRASLALTQQSQSSLRRTTPSLSFSQQAAVGLSDPLSDLPSTPSTHRAPSEPSEAENRIDMILGRKRRASTPKTNGNDGRSDKRLKRSEEQRTRRGKGTRRSIRTRANDAEPESEDGEEEEDVVRRNLLPLLVGWHADVYCARYIRWRTSRHLRRLSPRPRISSCFCRARTTTTKLIRMQQSDRGRLQQSPQLPNRLTTRWSRRARSRAAQALRATTSTHSCALSRLLPYASVPPATLGLTLAQPTMAAVVDHRPSPRARSSVPPCTPTGSATVEPALAATQVSVSFLAVCVWMSSGACHDWRCC